MKKTLILGLALALVGGVAYANFCARDVVPAASLLVPYAVVDLNADGTPNSAGYTTLFAVTNVSSAYALVHITVWSAQSNPVVDWDELLTGYDVWTINFRDLLTGNFNLFDTGAAKLAPKPTTGPPVYGPSSNIYTTALPVPVDPTVPISGCNFPYGARVTLGPIITGKLQADITAQLKQYVPCKGSVPNFTSPPWLTGLTANPVFFYVTADVVTTCNTYFPNQGQYWTANTGQTKFPASRNVLIGDVIWVNSTTNYSESVPAVHLEAGLTMTQNFYTRYAVTNLDDREPLATAFGFRYISSGASTNIIVWKDSNEADWDTDSTSATYNTPNNDTGITYACRPYVYYAFDESENALARGGGGPSGFDIAEPNVIPFETQSAPLNATNWDGIPAANGWMLLVFDPSIPRTDQFTPTVHQAWVGVRYLSAGYSTALEAAVLANANCFTGQVLPRLGINAAPYGTFSTAGTYLP